MNQIFDILPRNSRHAIFKLPNFRIQLNVLFFTIVWEPQHKSKSGYYLKFRVNQKLIKGKRVPGTCEIALDLYKNVAERGHWSRFFMQAANQVKHGKYQSAYVHYAVLAEMGYSTAQANVAHLLEEHQIRFLTNWDTECFLGA